MGIVLELAAALIFIICMCFLLYWGLCWKQGDCAFRIYTGKMTPLTVEQMELGTVVFSTTVPIRNIGKQNGTLMDVFSRVYLPGEQYNKVDTHILTMDINSPREDNYWEAVIVPKKETITLQIKLFITGKSGNILRDLDGIPDIPVDVIYQAVGRSDWYYAKERIYLTSDEMRMALYNFTAGGRP